MIDLGAEIVSLLTPIAPTEYQYPQSFAKFPIISYFTSGDELGNYYNGKATTEDIEITVDVWERINPKTGELIEIHSLVESTLRNAGYRRISFVTLNEADNKGYHYSMRFRKLKEVID